MKIRTVEDLMERLDSELAWRKKEISHISFFIERSDFLKKGVLVRCGIALLYGHWEGFVKKGANYFLEYVAMQKLANKDLSMNLLTLSFLNSVTIPTDCKKRSPFGAITDFFLNSLEGRSKIPYNSGVDTGSNLSSKMFKEIAWCLGIDYRLFEAKENLIDMRLLRPRNQIAHGEHIEMKEDEFIELKKEVLELMTLFKNQIENNIVQKLYRRLV